MSGKRSGFSRFPLLAVGQGESQQPTDSSCSNSRTSTLTPRITEGWGKFRPAGAGLFLNATDLHQPRGSGEIYGSPCSALVSTYQVSGRQLRSGREVVLCTNEVAVILYRAFESDLSKLDFSVGQFGQHIKPSLTLERLGRLA